MPVTVRKIHGKYRVVEAKTGRIAKNRAGTAVDGGGSKSKEKVARQARAINANQHSKGKR